MAFAVLCGSLLIDLAMYVPSHRTTSLVILAGAAGWMAAAFLFVSAVVMVGVRLRHDIGWGVAIAASLWAYSEALRRDRYAEFGSKEAVWDSIAPAMVIIDRNLSTCCVAPIMTTDYLDLRGDHEVAELEGEHYPVPVYAKVGGA